ncbi:hypothetical protein RUM44_011949 [Polyplax serrata]|uniref:Uncharacterized protein n=1 Tax=Polyplax serrata TaxID=468196 RepID=A0ABR1B9X7_POLSC
MAEAYSVFVFNFRVIRLRYGSGDRVTNRRKGYEKGEKKHRENFEVAKSPE